MTLCSKLLYKISLLALIFNFIILISRHILLEYAKQLAGLDGL